MSYYATVECLLLLNIIGLRVRVRIDVLSARHYHGIEALQCPVHTGDYGDLISFRDRSFF